MPTRSLTTPAVERIKPPKQGQADHFDQGYPGLALRVSYGGAKTLGLLSPASRRETPPAVTWAMAIHGSGRSP